MFWWVLLLFLVVPAIEITLFIQFGQIIGVWSTLFLIFGTAILGSILFRLQGLATLARIRQSLDQKQLPAIELTEGLVLLLSGVFLLTPGFLTDTVGFVALLPGFRRHLAIWLLKQMHIMRVVSAHSSDQTWDQSRCRTIEGEYHRRD